MSRLRRINRMCSRTVSDPANRLLKRTDSKGSSSVAEKKSSVVPLFSERSHVGNLHQIRKQGKGRSSKRKENRRLSFLFAPAAGATVSRAPQSALPAEVQRKTPRPSGANTLTQFVCPGQPVQRKVPPGQGEHANAVRAPRWVGAEKGAARTGRTRLRQFVHPGQPVLKKLPPHSGEPPARFVCPA